MTGAAAYFTAIVMLAFAGAHGIQHVAAERTACERDYGVCAVRIETLAVGETIE